MAKLKTATGKEFDCDHLTTIPSPAFAFIRVLNTPLASVAAVFSDPSETMQLWYDNLYLAHYTKLVSLIPEGSAVKVSLEKE